MLGLTQLLHAHTHAIPPPLLPLHKLPSHHPAPISKPSPPSPPHPAAPPAPHPHPPACPSPPQVSTDGSGGVYTSGVEVNRGQGNEGLFMDEVRACEGAGEGGGEAHGDVGARVGRQAGVCVWRGKG